MSSLRRRTRAMREAKQARVRSLMALPVFLFKISSILVVTGAFVFYLTSLPDSNAYFTSRAGSESLTVNFGNGVEQEGTTLSGTTLPEEEEELTHEDEPVEPQPPSDEEPNTDPDPDDEPETDPDPDEESETDPDNQTYTEL